MKSLLKQFSVLILTLVCAAVAIGGNITNVSGTSHDRAAGVLVDPPQFSIPIVVNNHDSYSYGISFGVHPSATKGIDPALGEREYPPFPPCCGTTMFVTDGGNAILDLRPYTSPTQIDTFVVGSSPELESYPITYMWPDLHGFYSGSVRLRNDLSGSLFDIDMKAQNSFVLASGPYIHYDGGPLPGTATLKVYVIAEGPLSGNSLPMVTTYGFGGGAFEAIVNAPPGPVNAGKATTGTTAWFDFGPTLSYGSSTAAQIISDGSMMDFSSVFDTNSMPPNSRYHFRAVAQNSLGTFYGGDRFISRGTPPPLTYADTGKFRTATYLDWANARDQYNKRKSVKPKGDKVIFKFNVLAPGNATGLKLKFNMKITGALTRGTIKTDTLVTIGGGGANEVDYIGSIVVGDEFQLDGVGTKGKILTTTFDWGTSPHHTRGTVPAGNFITNSPRFPMPNLHNVGEGIYGGGPIIVVGFNKDLKGPHMAYHSSYHDVLRSFVKEKKSGDLYHVDPPRCLNTFDNNHHEILREQKSLPPDKHNNILFAEQLTLKLNMTASSLGFFPEGLSTLIYDNHVSDPTPFDGMMVCMIVARVDSFLGCDEAPEIDADSDAYQKVVHNINGAFSAPIDTQSWKGGRVVCTGVRTVAEVPFFRPGASPAPNFAIGLGTKNQFFDQPRAFELSQNYPNPFNPSTTIKFNLPGPAVVTLRVYNVLGQEVVKLLDAESMDEGEQSVQFIATNLASGVYFYRLEAQRIGDEGTLGQKFVSVKKMMLVK